MSLHQELPVYKASYDLLMEIFSFTKEFSKEYKYTVGESLKKETIELLTLIFRANSRTDYQQVFLLPGVSRHKLPRQSLYTNYFKPTTITNCRTRRLSRLISVLKII